MHRMSIESDLTERERGFWTGSVAHYERWLVPQVLMVFPAPVGILDRDAALAGIRSGSR